MKGQIKIEDYKIHCIVGTHPHERKGPQELTVDLTVKVDLSECVLTDSISDTINYEEIGRVLQDLAKERRYHLLETFAFEALHKLFEEFTFEWAKISVKKKHALPLAAAAVVELEKHRDEA